ncbi:uncharacterized protein J3D65DRAFT_600689 [Phyllosticta citribraziliensis]|uniref:Uncharacterized protein n=1 Tax=Phyllosticta citribraziliensis TaxID=989973 RepID=A0ABR1LZC3_9PEZI
MDSPKNLSKDARHDRDRDHHIPVPVGLSKLQQTGRSSTFAAPPPKESRRSHLGLHHHKHHHGHHHHGHRDKYAEDREIKSAVLPASKTPFGELVRPSKEKDKDPKSTSVGDGSTSTKEGSLTALNEALENSFPRVPTRIVRPEDVEKERAFRKQREEQLQTALDTLSEQSMATTRRLDDTYYSILEKVSGLRSMIDHLQELSSLTKDLRTEFATDADELTEEVNNSLDNLGDFKAQAEQLDDFESRITSSKEKARLLRVRLDAAKKRVDEREKLEEEWRIKTSRRLRMLWGILGALAALFLISYILYSIRSQSGDVADFLLSSNKTVEYDLPSSVREVFQSLHSSQSSPTYQPSVTSEGMGNRDSGPLRILDEL